LQVDVAALEREPLLGSESGAGDHDWERATLGRQLFGDPVELVPRTKHCDLSALGLGVRDRLCDVLGNELGANGIPKHLAQRLVRMPRRALRQALPPRADRTGVEPVDADRAEPMLARLRTRLDGNSIRGEFEPIA
jgi:hypothetical protein